ncbi:MAG: glycosyltransferase family 4 protein [Candidatus Binataceae bacterium]
MLTELCEDLSASHEVEVIAGPCYHGSQDNRRPLSHQQLGHVSIIRTWGTRFSKRRLCFRLLNLASYFSLSGIAALRIKRPDVVVAETDPPLLGIIGAMIKSGSSSRFIYYCQDIYPDIARVTGGVRSRPLLKLLEWANAFAYSQADVVVVLGRDMARRLEEKGVPRKKIVIIPNWVDCKQVIPRSRGNLRAQFGDKFIVMYSGNLGLSQQLDNVLRAADRLKDDPRIQFVLIGEGARKQSLMRLAVQMTLTNLIFLPYQPRESLSDSLTAADLHLIPLMPGVQSCMVPSKVYGILAAGRPFVAVMEPGAEIAQLAIKYGVGFVSPPHDVESLVNVIISALLDPNRLQQMGARARHLAEVKFDRKIVTSQFASLLDSLKRSEKAAH